jgi:predicted nuclease of predicted toxin-antitoxin system
MKFKVDENLPVEVTDLLQRTGHDALSVVDQDLGGKADKIINRVCQEENRVIITLDLDFADIRTYPPGEFAGIVVLRLKNQDKFAVMAVVEDLLKVLEKEPLDKRLWIVDEQRIRIRE